MNDVARPTVSLVLGSGAARGYAHIGAIEELLAQGYDIRSVAGASMGALVGGIYAAGKLDAYRDWVKTLQRLDVLRLLDWTLRGGLIKGDRLLDKLRDLIGEVNIEDLRIPYTAVAVDLLAQKEVWFSRGPLFEAIRASIAIPALLRPHLSEGRLLVDGALLNPVPITPTLRDQTDCTIAVDVNAPVELPEGEGTIEHADARASAAAATTTAEPASAGASLAEAEAAATGAGEEAAEDAQVPSYAQRLSEFIGGLLPDKKPDVPADPGILELFGRSLDVVQETIARFKLAAQPPDLLVRVPRDACAFYEFHRAEEMIELGRMRMRAALRDFRVERRA
jgi:NTE family protein